MWTPRGHPGGYKGSSFVVSLGLLTPGKSPGHRAGFHWKYVVAGRSCDNSKANAAKTSRKQLIAESKISADELLKAVQDECRRESTDDANLAKLREDAATRMQDSLERGKLPTVIAGTRQNTDEPPIFENELQTISGY